MSSLYITQPAVFKSHSWLLLQQQHICFLRESLSVLTVSYMDTLLALQRSLFHLIFITDFSLNTLWSKSTGEIWQNNDPQSLTEKTFFFFFHSCKKFVFMEKVKNIKQKNSSDSFRIFSFPDTSPLLEWVVWGIQHKELRPPVCTPMVVL